MEFLNRFLQMVGHEMRNVDSPHIVYRFEYDVSKSNSIFLKKFEKESEFSFLPEWYIKVINEDVDLKL